ncbi:COP9 signalosome complex subunit 3 [Linnemannia elongata]|nr:COP9 signalosome complex subunit 3 [Linnemannia elongata]
MAPSDPSFDEIISKILAATDITAVTKTLAPYLNNLNDPVFAAQSNGQADPLDALDPAIHSFAYLYFLVHRCKASHGFDHALLAKVWAFVTTCDGEQVRLASHKAMSFAEALVKVATETRQPIIAIKPLAIFIQRLQASPGQLTMIHPLLAKTCLLAQSVKDILPILDNDISDVKPQQTHINYKDFLLYHYYGGMIYAFLKKFERAVEFFKLAVSAPAEVASAIQIEAHKKYVLSSLLQYGRVLPLPKYIASAVQRTIKVQCVAYADFATAYEKKSNSAIRTELEKAKPIFVRDKNFGLAKQCMEALHRRNIQDLTCTYLTLSIENITSLIGLGSEPDGARRVEGIIVRMIESGAIFATISHEHAGGMVSFLDDPNQHNNTITMDMINTQIQKATAITAKLSAMDQAISSMPAFFNKQGSHGPDQSGYSMDESDYSMHMGYDNYVDEVPRSNALSPIQESEVVVIAKVDG